MQSRVSIVKYHFMEMIMLLIYPVFQKQVATFYLPISTLFTLHLLHNNMYVYTIEKYEKTLYKGPKVKANPQDIWMTLVMNAVTNSSQAPHNIRSQLERLGSLTNIPRNEKKFNNFVKNSLKLYNDSLISDIWNYLASFKTTPVPSSSSVKASIPPTSTPSDQQSSTDDTNITVESNNNHDNEVVKKEKKSKKDKKRSHNSDTLDTTLIPASSTTSDIPLPLDGDDDGDALNVKKKRKKDKKNKESTTDAFDNELPLPNPTTTVNEADTGIESADAAIEAAAKKQRKKEKKAKRDNAA